MTLIEGASLVAVLATAAFLLLQGALGLWRPQSVRRFLDGFAASAVAHFGELAARILMGMGFVGYSPLSAWPAVFAGFGWLLVLTSFPMLLVPWRWHRRFAQWSVPRATRWMPPYALACLGAGLAVVAGVVLAWSPG